MTTTTTTKLMDDRRKKPIFRQNIQLSDLPLDVLGTILSKLPPKETVRASTLSKKWKHIWTVCPKLRFDGATMCGDDAATGTHQYTHKFIGNVNGVLKQYRGKVVQELETPWLQGNSAKFSQLKYLQLEFLVLREDLSNLLSLASFLSAAPFIENLEIHSAGVALPDCSELIRRLPRTTHNYLKNLCTTGFAGCTGQVELLAHIVENAPNLETLTVDRVNCSRYDEEYERKSRSKALDIARKHLDGRTSQNTKVSML
ncbi:hypothetical protein BS78_K140400 [Paspalum vaginatum]|uniref:F-box domain-containing protein n=1 Tax=Paspalum vaginatum TaxID=158149 RepID=A0A9W7X9K1_9POAL|nr:hypothetical protein BS78_K140400 [Paspalum vaginatum]KAJ1255886.1 hypothetical protein BS78_K140400 [Paspalum vaginatum]